MITEPLDLRDVGERLDGPFSNEQEVIQLAHDAKALLAALRELRWAALWEVERHGHWHGRGDMASCDCRLCTALDKVRDDA